MRNRKLLPFTPLEGEVWRQVVGFEGLYEVSNLQRVKSLKRTSNNSHFTTPERLLRHGYHKFGYMKFRLSKNGKIYDKFIHRLIADAFIPNPNNLPCINHIDNDPKNNKIDNLEWCTWSHNTRHAYRQERICKLGEKNHMVKLSTENVIEIFNSQGNKPDLAKKLHISIQTINDIKAGRRWSSVTGKHHPSIKKRICE